MICKSKIKEENYNNVVYLFKNSEDNTTTSIANKLNLKVEKVNYLLDLYLSKKKNYTGRFADVENN